MTEVKYGWYNEIPSLRSEGQAHKNNLKKVLTNRNIHDTISELRLRDETKQIILMKEYEP